MFKSVALAIVVSAMGLSASLAAPGKGNDCGKHPGNPGCSVAAPEIDGSTAVAGLTLLAGGVAVMLGRRSKRLQTQAG